MTIENITLDFIGQELYITVMPMKENKTLQVKVPLATLLQIYIEGNANGIWDTADGKLTWKPRNWMETIK